jgi:DNA-directed RNA polymerase alpha subunit
MDAVQHFKSCGATLEFRFHPQSATWVCVIDDRTFLKMKSYELPLLDRHVDELELETRTSNCLLAEGVETIRQLIAYTPQRLLRVSNFGRRSLRDVEEALARVKLGLSVEVSI